MLNDKNVSGCCFTGMQIVVSAACFSLIKLRFCQVLCLALQSLEIVLHFLEKKNCVMLVFWFLTLTQHHNRVVVLAIRIRERLH